MEQRTARPRIADVAREAGVSKTAVSFAFNSPDRLAPDTAERILGVADQLGYRPHPVARMLSQGETLTIGMLTPQALSVIFSNPFFGAFSEGVALAAEESGYALVLHLAAARQPRRCDAPGDGRRRRRDRPERRSPRGRADPPGRACRSCSSTRRHCRSTARSRSTTPAARGRPRSTSSRLGHRDVLVIGVEPPAPSRAMDHGGVVARRLQRLSRCVRGGRCRTSPTTGSSSDRPRIEGGRAALARAWEDGIAGDGRPGHERRDGDRRDAGAARPAGWPSRATSASSASTTSTSPSTSTRR